jgi:hypothetical protein
LQKINQATAARARTTITSAMARTFLDRLRFAERIWDLFERLRLDIGSTS